MMKRVLALSVISIVLVASISLGAESKPQHSAAQAERKEKTPAELRTDFKRAMIDYYTNPISADAGRALCAVALECLWSADSDTVKLVCDSAAYCNVYPLWRAVRDFQNRYETLEPRLSRPHVESHGMVFYAWREMVLEGAHAPVDQGRATFTGRGPDDKVYYLRAYFWEHYPSAEAACWTSERLAIINNDEATAALRDIIKMTEERAKKFTDQNAHTRHLPDLKNALRFNEAVRDSGTPTKAAASLVVLENFTNQDNYGFLGFALKATLNVHAEGHDAAIMEVLKKVAAEAAKAEHDAKSDIERVPFSSARGAAEYWLRRYEWRQEFPKSLR